MFIASILCTTLMNDTKRIHFVWGKQKSVKKIVSPKYNFSWWWVLCTPTDNNVLRKNFLIKESFHRICFRNTSFNYSHHFLCPIDPLLQTFQTFFLKRKVFCEKKVLQKRNFLFYLRNSVLPLITMLFKTFFWKNTSLKNFKF